MSRGFWTGMMLVSLVLTGASGGYLYLALIQKSQPVAPVKPSRPRPSMPTVPAAQTDPAAAVSTAASSGLQPQAAINEEKAKEISSGKKKSFQKLSKSKSDKKNDETRAKGASQKQSVSFQFKHPSAKQVFIIGNFNKWYRQTMRKGKDGLWEFSTRLAPGTYEYLFVVDGKRTLDPNRPSDSNSEKSILKVESHPPKSSKASNQ